MTAETRKGRAVRRMAELAADGRSPWTAIQTVLGATIRRSWIEATPDWARRDWNEESYQAHVFLTWVGGGFVLGVARAPWVGRQDSNVPLWLVEQILEDPELALSSERMNALRADRKAARR